MSHDGTAKMRLFPAWNLAILHDAVNNDLRKTDWAMSKMIRSSYRGHGTFRARVVIAGS